MTTSTEGSFNTFGESYHDKVVREEGEQISAMSPGELRDQAILYMAKASHVGGGELATRHFTHATALGTLALVRLAEQAVQTNQPFNASP